jgi:hypothetical protein
MAVGALVVHGMGRQEPGFSEGLRSAVSTRLGELAESMVWQEVLWAPILEPRETALWTAMQSAVDPQGHPLDVDWRPLRRFVLHNFGDATGYQRDQSPESAGQLIHQRVSNAIELLQARLGDPAAPVVVLAHSLGGHIMSNYIWDRQHPSLSRPAALPLAPLPGLAGLITFGCNIPLFALAFRSAKPIDLPGVAVSDAALVAAVRWLNFFDRDDVLGWPLRPLYEKDAADFSPAHRRTLDSLEDHEISVGTVFTGWNPASHDYYWDNAGFVGHVADYLKTVVALTRS